MLGKDGHCVLRLLLTKHGSCVTQVVPRRSAAELLRAEPAAGRLGGGAHAVEPAGVPARRQAPGGAQLRSAGPLRLGLRARGPGQRLLPGRSPRPCPRPPGRAGGGADREGLLPAAVLPHSHGEIALTSIYAISPLLRCLPRQSRAAS